MVVESMTTPRTYSINIWFKDTCKIPSPVILSHYDTVVGKILDLQVSTTCRQFYSNSLTPTLILILESSPSISFVLDTFFVSVMFWFEPSFFYPYLFLELSVI